MTVVLERIRALLRDDPRVSPLDMRVRFIAFGPYSLDVEMIAYILTDDVPTFF